MSTEPVASAGAGGEAEEEKGVGIFPEWKWLYALVVVYGVLMIGALALLTAFLDFGTS